MTNDYQMLSKTAHKNLRVCESKLHDLQVATQIAPVLITEVDRLAAEFSLFFSKNSQTGDFVLVALLGFSDNENLFLADGQWQSSSIPLAFERHPFLIEQTDGSIFIDMQSPAVSTNEGERIFDDTDEASAYLQRKITVLEAIYNGAEPTQQFIKLLQEYNLLEPVKLDITFANQSQQSIDGLYTIASERLAGLAEQAMINLHKQNLLQPCFLVMHSLQHLQALIDKKNQRL
ncbi:SapC family protein [Catenovulum sediminis]|uniref:SapC family protein n=1 Tax=Catenovulum sediminis TaxID=1740262 RepID=A0ABV1RBW1_9ALTE